MLFFLLFSKDWDFEVLEKVGVREVLTEILPVELI